MSVVSGSSSEIDMKLKTYNKKRLKNNGGGGLEVGTEEKAVPIKEIRSHAQYNYRGCQVT